MATLDQLDPQQRAIIELVLKRGQSYDDLAGTLDLTAGRVRELARAALAELAPTTAERVDAQWRGQLADYVLGQQTGPEAKATQGHLKSSEPARMWAVSLMDSLHGLYANGARPEIPGPDGDTGRGGRSASSRGRLRPAGGGPGGRSGSGAPRAGGRPSGSGTGADAPSGGAGGGRSLSPEARQAVRRRRLMVAGAALVLLLLVAGGIYGASGGDSGSAPASTPGGPTAAGAPQNAGGEPKVLGQVLLRPLRGEQGVGRGTLAQQGNRRLLVVQAQDLAKLPSNELLEVWLYNSPKDARSLGAQQVKNGKFQGLGDLPSDAGRYRFIDLSLEKADRNPAHSGHSVLRADLAQAQSEGQPGGGAAPTPAP